MQAHYKRSNYGGFVTDTFNLTLDSYVNNFEKVEGTRDSKYAVVKLCSTIAYSEYSELIFLNDLDEAIAILHRWLNQTVETQEFMEKHFYGMILDIQNDKELGYGDSWSTGEAGWCTFSGVTED